MSLPIYKGKLSRSPYYLVCIEPVSGRKLFKALSGVEEVEIVVNDTTFALKGVLLTGKAATQKRMELRAAGYKAD